MISVSDAFNTAAKATVRRPIAKVDIVWTDRYIDPYITHASNDSNRVSWLTQTTDLIEPTARKWAHLDGVIVADGSYYPAPSTTIEAGENQIGWFGEIASDVNGEFSTDPYLLVGFSARPVIAFLVTGDSVYNEYPVDFDIEVYDGVTLLHTEVVTGNTLLRWSKNVFDRGLNDVDSMKLIIKKWSHAGRVVKITEFYTSIVETYTGDDIVSLSLLEEREISDGALPIGNISANEIELELQNIKLGDTVDPFFPSNPNSYLHTLLKRNRMITAYIGFITEHNAYEYCKLGTFFSGDWVFNERSFSVSVIARDRMELLRKAEFSSSDVYEGYTLYQLAELVLTDAKTNIPMPQLVWSIDTALQDYLIPYAFFKKKSYMKTIRDIVEACTGLAYMSKEDVLIIEGPVS